MGVDRDRSGFVDHGELQTTLTGFGYRLSPPCLGILMARYGSNGRVAFDDFVALCVKLRVLTRELYFCLMIADFHANTLLSLSEQFQARDSQRNGTATFQYDDVSAHLLP